MTPPRLQLSSKGVTFLVWEELKEWSGVSWDYATENMASLPGALGAGYN